MKNINEKILQQLNHALEIQGMSGNWNYDPYMHGMYNGLAFALGVIENKDPDYKEAPDEWLADKTIEPLSENMTH